ncbi:MAG: hypothetical protein ACRC35_04605 [Angustibacter sp.]
MSVKPGGGCDFGNPDALPCDPLMAAECKDERDRIFIPESIFTRRLSPSGTPIGDWEYVDWTCGPTDTPAASAGLTPAVVSRVVRDLPFARPTLATSPPGGQTLVNLPTYFAVRWPARGLQPDETTTVILLGRRVQIRPVAVSYTYDFGDGTTTGPTSDPGGLWPDGQIIHTYEALDPKPATVTCVYSARYRTTPNGTWQTLDLTIPITGTPRTVRVYEAINRLYDDPDSSPPTDN